MRSSRLVRPDSGNPPIVVGGNPRESTTYPSDPTDLDDLDGRSVRRGREVRRESVGFRLEEPGG